MTQAIPDVTHASQCTDCRVVLPTRALSVYDVHELCMACWRDRGLPWLLWSPEVGPLMPFMFRKRIALIRGAAVPEPVPR